MLRFPYVQLPCVKSKYDNKPFLRALIGQKDVNIHPYLLLSIHAANRGRGHARKSDVFELLCVMVKIFTKNCLQMLKNSFKTKHIAAYFNVELKY